MIRKTAKLPVILVVIAGCSSPDSASDAGSDVGRDQEMSVIDQGELDAGSDSSHQDVAADLPDLELDPREYCETTVGLFCDYYLRCGRIAATDEADCERNFLETCNQAYEPQYAALADRGQLVLSAEGIETCRAHLAVVACERQLFDLDGPCSDVWTGQGVVGDPCAPGIGSFVCGVGTECVLDLSLCGTCEPAGAAAEACVDDRCTTGAMCIDGLCKARGLPGDVCDDVRICVTGSSCDLGTCVGLTIVGVGDACDGANRCPYQSTCRGSLCVQDALLGESCAAASCASAWCDGTICREFITPGDPCAEAFQCLSGRCEAGVCAEPVAGCFDP